MNIRSLIARIFDSINPIVWLLAAFCIAMLLSKMANAQVVLACADGWGSSDKCGGCSGLAWRTPAPALKVKTDKSDFWTTLSTLAPTDTVYTQSGKRDGDAVVCSEATPTTVAALTSAPSPIPIPTPSPPPNPTPPTGTGQLALTWTAPPVDTNGRPSAITEYRVSWVGPVSGQQTLGAVTAHTVANLPTGTYSATVTSIDATGESVPTNPVTKVIAEPAPTPQPPPPTPAPPRYTVKAIAAGTRPATEAVLPLTGTALVLGHKLGNIAVGKPCGDDVIVRSGTTEYRAVNETDVALLSPTYSGRQLVAVCAR